MEMTIAWTAVAYYVVRLCDAIQQCSDDCLDIKVRVVNDTAKRFVYDRRYIRAEVSL